MGLWPLNTTGNKLDPNKNSLFIFSAGGYGCYGCPTESMIFKLNGTKMSSVVNDLKSVQKRDVAGNYIDILLGDPRIFRYQGKTYAQCVGNRFGVQQLYLTEVGYEEYREILYVKEPFLYLSVEHEYGHVSQKNWSPFEYQFIRKKNSTNAMNLFKLQSKTFFVFSVIPHRIVDVNESLPGVTDVMKGHTICETEIIDVTPVNQIWKWGPIHGGTNSLLVDTPYGPRYLAIFHSQSKWMEFWLTTYFMGAYMFETHPPFAITHISDAPLVPSELYLEAIDGWAFRAIDYIMFPMNLIQYEEDKLILSLGRNDKSGYMIVMNKTSLVTSLRPVQSRVVRDTFYEHAHYSHYN